MSKVPSSGSPARLCSPSPVSENDRMAYDLERFLDAQERVYDRVLDELRGGRKVSHWMWFIFPQMAGLGPAPCRSATPSPRSTRRAPTSPTRCWALACASAPGSSWRAPGGSAEGIFGPIDALKLRSCMTLYHRAAPEDPLFAQVLERFYGGVADDATDALLA